MAVVSAPLVGAAGGTGILYVGTYGLVSDSLSRSYLLYLIFFEV